MPDIDNDDLDNLFRRAAEGYPLRTNSSDWDKVARKLDEDESDERFIIPPVYSGEEKNKRRRILLLLLLLPLMGIGYYLYNTHFSSTKNIAVTSANSGENSISQKTKKENKTVINKETINNSNEKNTDNKSANINNSLDENEATAKIKNQNTNTTKDAVINDVAVNTENSNNINDINISENKIKNSSDNKSVNKNSNNKNRKGKTVFEKIFGKDYTGSVQNKNSLNTIINNNDAANAELHSISGFSIIPLAYTNFVNPDINGKNVTNSVASFIRTDSNSVNNKKKTSGKKQPSFYTGIIVAPDLSTVKFQSIKGAGYSAGILLGYTLSKKLAIETGAYYDYKKYYTKGEYFHSSFPNYVNVLNVDGACRMIEVPVNLRYNFINNDQIKWFATTGLSSYFMFKEGYNYNYLYNGMAAHKYYTYKNGSQNWVSVLNISAGYEHTLGNVGNLRLEPYVKIPLSGMGTGSLPIMSVGLNVGITHSFK